MNSAVATAALPPDVRLMNAVSALLVAVLLESEFVYRLEFGTGEPDEFGRRRLSPREASYAIAYALGRLA